MNFEQSVQIAERIIAANQKRLLARQIQEYHKREVANARRLGVKFVTVGVHTIAYTCAQDVITFASTIKAPTDKPNPLYGRFLAAMRYMQGNVAFVRKGSMWGPRHALERMFSNCEW